jgi:hypothetical protein
MQLFLILQYTPFPNHYEPMPLWQLQKAEYDLKINKRFYHEQAAKTGDGLLLYPLEVAEKIISYWSKKYPFADFQLKRRPNTGINPTAQRAPGETIN